MGSSCLTLMCVQLVFAVEKLISSEYLWKPADDDITDCVTLHINPKTRKYPFSAAFSLDQVATGYCVWLFLKPTSSELSAEPLTSKIPRLVVIFQLPSPVITLKQLIFSRSNSHSGSCDVNLDIVEKTETCSTVLH